MSKLKVVHQLLPKILQGTLLWTKKNFVRHELWTG